MILQRHRHDQLSRRGEVAAGGHGDAVHPDRPGVGFHRTRVGVGVLFKLHTHDRGNARGVERNHGGDQFVVAERDVAAVIHFVQSRFRHVGGGDLHVVVHDGLRHRGFRHPLRHTGLVDRAPGSGVKVGHGLVVCCLCGGNRILQHRERRAGRTGRDGVAECLLRSGQRPGRTAGRAAGIAIDSFEQGQQRRVTVGHVLRDVAPRQRVAGIQEVPVVVGVVVHVAECRPRGAEAAVVVAGRDDVAEILVRTCTRCGRVDFGRSHADQSVQRTLHGSHGNHGRHRCHRRHEHGARDLIIEDVRCRDISLARGLTQRGSGRERPQSQGAERHRQ